MISYKYKPLNRILSIMLLVCMLLTFSSCGGNGTVTTSTSAPKIITPEQPNAKNHSTGSLKSVCKSGLYELLLDEEHYSFALKDSAGNIWYGLPKIADTNASLLSMDVIDGKKSYRLNSQDNSVAFGTAKCMPTKNGIVFSYVLSEKKDNPEITIPVTMNLTLDDGLLNVSVDCSKLEEYTKDIKISTMSLIPYFGAVETPTDGDFLLIPDGSGALINLVGAEDAQYSVETYGADYAVETSNEHNSIIGAFGLKNKTSAFAAIITEGDAISKINANIKKDGIDNVYASFNVTPNGVSTSTKDKKESNYAIADDSYEGKISVCYRFISGSSATYSGLAAMCREQLIRDGLLSTRSVDDENAEVPLNVTLIGANKGGIGGTSVYTNFENAEDIAAVLKAKGIDSLNIRYDGAFSGGLNQKSIGSAKLISKLGKSSAYESLQNYVTTQGFNLYFTVNLITAASGGSKATGVLDNNVNILKENSLKSYVGSDNFETQGLSTKTLTENVVSFMNAMKNYNIQGYCIADAGNTLFSDCSNRFVDRQTQSESVFGQAIALSTNKNLMVEHGNLYALKNALLVSDIPMGVSYKETANYMAVPFVQMVLHGTVEYTGGYLNLAKDYNTLLLRSLEYGALPAFEFTYKDYVPKDAESSKLYYDNWTSKALDVYTTFNSVLSGLRDAKMTGHKKIQDNLYCTEYNNETFIYVNYSAEDISYNNLTIKAGSFLRVN